jgi:hypothetical protein
MAKPLMKPNQHAWLWWISAVAISVGLSLFFLLETDYEDPEIQRYRGIALVAALFIPGLCLVIGTSKRWFGKDL